MEQIPKYKSARIWTQERKIIPLLATFNHVAICGPHFSFFFLGQSYGEGSYCVYFVLFAWATRCNTCTILCHEWGAWQGGCNHSLIYIYIYIYIHTHTQSLLSSSFAVFAFPPVIWLKLLSRCTCVYTQEYIYIYVSVNIYFHVCGVDLKISGFPEPVWHTYLFTHVHLWLSDLLVNLHVNTCMSAWSVYVCMLTVLFMYMCTTLLFACTCMYSQVGRSG